MMLLLLILTVIVVSVGLAGYGFGTLGRIGLRRAGRHLWLRGVAALLGSVTAALYAWGLLFVGLDVVSAEDGGTDSAPIQPCRGTGEDGWKRAMNVVGYDVDYIPLRFVCESEGGEEYDAASVPSYLNPAVAGFAVATVVCVSAVAIETERRARREHAA